MLVIPKIELAGRRSVRAGEDGTAGDPLSAARDWVDDGFTRLHVADADAIARHRSNVRALESIARSGIAELQVSAGSESEDDIDSLVEAGANRIVLGARGASEIDWLAAAADAYPGTLIVETRVHERRVVTRGWVRTLPVDLLDLVDDLTGFPLAALLVVSRANGALAGVELSLLEDAALACTVPVFVEDARPSMRDLYAFEQRGLAAVVVPESGWTMLDRRAVGAEFGR